MVVTNRADFNTGVGSKVVTEHGEGIEARTDGGERTEAHSLRREEGRS